MVPGRSWSANIDVWNWTVIWDGTFTALKTVVAAAFFRQYMIVANRHYANRRCRREEMIASIETEANLIVGKV